MCYHIGTTTVTDCLGQQQVHLGAGWHWLYWASGKLPAASHRSHPPVSPLIPKPCHANPQHITVGCCSSSGDEGRLPRISKRLGTCFSCDKDRAAVKFLSVSWTDFHRVLQQWTSWVGCCNLFWILNHVLLTKDLRCWSCISFHLQIWEVMKPIKLWIDVLFI